jgi:hypothetical protein
MGLLVARPKLEPGELLRFNALANHVEGPSYTLWGLNAAAGGRLVVTDRRVFFQPGRVDGMLRARRWVKPLDAVTGLEVVDRDGAEVFAGGMRRRLGIRTADGVEVFVVNGLEEKIPELRAYFPRA